MKRRKIIAANWKMNLTLPEAVQLIDAIKPAASSNCDIIVIPSFPFLHPVIAQLEAVNISVGAQNCSTHNAGALTGEVSVSQLNSIGAQYVLIGHSERREHFQESNAMLKV